MIGAYQAGDVRDEIGRGGEDLDGVDEGEGGLTGGSKGEDELVGGGSNDELPQDGAGEVGRVEVREKDEVGGGDVKEGGGEVEGGGGEGVEVEAEEVMAGMDDPESVGGGGGEDPGCAIERGRDRGVGKGDGMRRGEVEGWRDSGVGDEDTVVIQGGNGGGAAGDEEVVSGGEEGEGGGDEMEEEEEKKGRVSRIRHGSRVGALGMEMGSKRWRRRDRGVLMRHGWHDCGFAGRDALID